MRHLIFLCALIAITSPAFAAKKDKTAMTRAAVAALAKYCLPPISERQNPAAFAVKQGLVELPSDQAAKFSPQGGKVFDLPSSFGNAVLMTSDMYGDTCAIAVHELKPAPFWEALDTTMKGFSLMREKRLEDERVTKKEYALETLSGTVTLLVTASDVPRQNGLQALMTLARVQK